MHQTYAITKNLLRKNKTHKHNCKFEKYVTISNNILSRFLMKQTNQEKFFALASKSNLIDSYSRKNCLHRYIKGYSSLNIVKFTRKAET